MKILSEIQTSTFDVDDRDNPLLVDEAHEVKGDLPLVENQLDCDVVNDLSRGVRVALSGGVIEEDRLYEYEVQSSDLETLAQGIDLLYESGLIEEGILDDMRFATYDSKYLYVFTRGQHSTNDRFVVEEVHSSSKTGFKIFKIRHRGFIGGKEKDYFGARSWLLCDEIETTSNDRKFPNGNVVFQPDLPQPREILNVVSMAPVGPWNEFFNEEGYKYLTDIVFHEAGHIEHRRLENWQEGEGRIVEFPSEDQRKIFLSTIRQTKIFPSWITELIILNIGRIAIAEMYAMLIDREGAKRYDAQKFDSDNARFQRKIAYIQDNSADQENIDWFKRSLESGHTTGRLLVRILEEQFPDFLERKKFVRSVLGRTQVTD